MPEYSNIYKKRPLETQSPYDKRMMSKEDFAHQLAGQPHIKREIKIKLSLSLKRIKDEGKRAIRFFKKMLRCVTIH